MSEDRKWKLTLGLGDAAFWVMFFAWLILCIGEPDLLDTLIAWIARQP